MRPTVLKDPHLHRYWFTVPGHIGVGVTAHSVGEAVALARDVCAQLDWPFDPGAVTEDVDVRDLDQNHIVPNIGPVNFRGVWYPRMNI